MPELPEAETIKRQVAERYTDKYLRLVKFSNGEELNISSTLKGLERRGKKIILEFENSKFIIITLGMTGRLLVDELSVHSRHTRATLWFEDDRLFFDDVRKFGGITLSGKLPPAGLDPINDFLSPETITELYQSMKPLKQLLMEQGLIAGIGNIYSSEILYRSKIHPLKYGKTLSLKDASQLLSSITEILNKAINCGGTTIMNFTDIFNNRGRYQHNLMVYGKKRCGKCNSDIKTIKIYGRNTYYCPVCQKV